MQQTIAVRKTKGAKTYIEVTNTDGTTDTLGGKRAERANAVIIITDRDGVTGAYGLRADTDKAKAEDARLLRPTVRKWRGTFFDGVEQVSISMNMVNEARAKGVEVTYKQVTHTYESAFTAAEAIVITEEVAA